MNDREKVRYDMFGRAETFGANNAADFSPTGEATRRFNRVREIVIQLDRDKATQGGGSATSKEVLLDGLRLDLQNISRTARALDQDEPGMAAKFRSPDSPSQAALLTAADSFILQLAPQPDDTPEVVAAKDVLA